MVDPDEREEEPDEDLEGEEEPEFEDEELEEAEDDDAGEDAPVPDGGPVGEAAHQLEGGEPSPERRWPERRPRPPRKLPHLVQADLEVQLDEHGRKHYFMKDGRAVCGRLKRLHNRAIPDEACLGIPMASGPCRIHGGKAGRPIETGRYARVMKSWKSGFTRALNDKELLDSRRELAVMDTVNEQLVERAEALDCPGWREEVLRTFRELRAAIRSQRHPDVAALMKRLGEQLEQGATADQVARDLVQEVDRRAARACKLSELDLRKQEKITVAELAAVFRKWLDVIQRNLPPEQYFRLVPKLREVTTMGVQVSDREP